ALTAAQDVLGIKEDGPDRTSHDRKSHWPQEKPASAGFLLFLERPAFGDQSKIHAHSPVSAGAALRSSGLKRPGSEVVRTCRPEQVAVRNRLVSLRGGR